MKARDSDEKCFREQKAKAFCLLSRKGSRNLVPFQHRTPDVFHPAVPLGLTSHRQLNGVAPLHSPGPNPVFCLTVVLPGVGGPQAVPRQLGLAAQEQGFPSRGAPEPAVADGGGPAGHTGQAGPGSCRDRQPRLAGPDDGLGRCNWKTKQMGPRSRWPWLCGEGSSSSHHGSSRSGFQGFPRRKRAPLSRHLSAQVKLGLAVPVSAIPPTAPPARGPALLG